MLGRIATVTINTPDLPAAVAAYQRYLGYRVVDDGALGRDTARAWARPALASARAVILEPASGSDTYLRFVEGPAYADYQPFACLGWNAVELIVADVDSLAGQLAGSPFRLIGAPADLSFTDKIRAMQVVGPAREVLYLTQIKERLAAFDTPEAAAFVDRAFIVILGGSSLDLLQDFYHGQFGVSPCRGHAFGDLRAVRAVRAAEGLPPRHRGAQGLRAVLHRGGRDAAGRRRPPLRAGPAAARRGDGQLRGGTAARVGYAASGPPTVPRRFPMQADGRWPASERLAS